MAHELNQPLASILYNAEAALALLDQTPADIAEVRETLKDILVEDRRAGEVIKRLRLLLTKGEVQRQPTDLNEIVQDVLKLVRVDLVSRGVAVQTELANGLPTVLADRIQLQQVVLNLIINGCDAMSNVPPADRQIVVRTSTEEDALGVSVSDRGQGLAPESLEKVFDPFYTTKSRGMGLGLSVCRTIISAHGGKLWAANNEDWGATFRFSLPASSERMTR
jgi:C4-dicarboxylate-specific signal transduction histidine kinase